MTRLGLLLTMTEPPPATARALLQTRRFLAAELPIALYELTEKPSQSSQLIVYRLYRP